VLCIVGGGGTTSNAVAGQSNPAAAAATSAHVGYQGSRRSAHRGRGAFRGRGGRIQSVWGGPTLQYLHFGTAFHYSSLFNRKNISKIQICKQR